MNPPINHTPPPFEIFPFFSFAVKWTPRLLVSFLSGYYCLGIAYEIGLLAEIDRLAIKILRPSMGYIGIAAFMPTFQWYSAWTVRVSIALCAGIAYDFGVKIIFYGYKKINSAFITPIKTEAAV